ncbi:MAG TPA: ABC transporter ATP-binding protein [Burkholderiales bacterium]|nr:ABC transporter ATP-binding protein [Burkholderiales bacterium]
MLSSPESPIIKVADLAKQVSTGNVELTILGGVSFEVRTGESVAVVGVSGSGKSTLLALLAGLDTPSTGMVRIDGHDLYGLDEDGRAALRGRMVGFIFQSFQLLPAMTALENVMLPLELSGRFDARPAAQAMLERVGLGPRLHHYPKQLSGGEQQRVAIARAFVTRPKLLFADEPTGNLDPATGAQIIDLMLGLNRESGTTLLMVTHDEALTRRCDRVLRLAAGRLVNHD